jgi:hypothetical protein
MAMPKSRRPVTSTQHLEGQAGPKPLGNGQRQGPGKETGAPAGTSHCQSIKSRVERIQDGWFQKDETSSDKQIHIHSSGAGYAPSSY